MKVETQPLRIFVAGPYAPVGNNPHDYARLANRNVLVAVEIGNRLASMGHYVFIPHLQHYQHLLAPYDLGGWYNDNDLSILRLWANALFFIAPSPGANVEREEAERLGYPVYVSLVDAPSVVR